MLKLSSHSLDLIRLALEEDIGKGDVTSNLLIPSRARGKAVLMANEKGIFCGEPVAREILRKVDPALNLEFFIRDGKYFSRNKAILKMTGNVRSLLKAERTLVNFLAHLSGIATRTRTFIDRMKRCPVLILDTRKTTPGMRELEKYAVKTGGGRNHRMGLYDAVFVKENHRPAGDFTRLKKFAGRFEIEVRNMQELKEALRLRPRIVLFDNFKPADLRRAVRFARAEAPHIILEASGGINLDNVAHYAAMGVDWLSVGALTHSAPALDFSLDIMNDESL